MPTYIQILYHIVFSTQKDENVLIDKNLEKLFYFIWEILKEKNCSLYRINAYKNHVHILTSLHPNVTLDDMVKEIKHETTIWIKKEKVFPIFSDWRKEYGAFTCSYEQKNEVANFIKNQKDYHQQKTYKEELLELLKKYKVKYNNKYLVK